MKALLINNLTYCDFPEGISNIDTFISYLNDNYQSFIKLVTWKEDECVAPYFIENEKEAIYMNVACIRNVTEKEITVLSKQEYEERLTEVVNRKCKNCKSYEEDCVDNLQGHRSMISLDGDCYGFERLE